MKEKRYFCDYMSRIPDDKFRRKTTLILLVSVIVIILTTSIIFYNVFIPNYNEDTTIIAEVGLSFLVGLTVCGIMLMLVLTVMEIAIIISKKHKSTKK